jgi:hypothetical protein
VSSQRPTFWRQSWRPSAAGAKAATRNSHDLEDLLTVIDGREAIVQELADTPALRSYIAE